MTASRRRYWFSAKGTGLGWGLPSAWPGWVVLGLVAVAMIVVSKTMSEARGAAVVLGVVMPTFLTVVFLKGDPAGRLWRRRGSSAPRR